MTVDPCLTSEEAASLVGAGPLDSAPNIQVENFGPLDDTTRHQRRREERDTPSLALESYLHTDEIHAATNL